MGDPFDVLQMQSFLGKIGELTLNGFTLDVRIKSARSYKVDKMEWLITPVSGKGEKWVPSHIVTLKKEQNSV